MNEPERKSVAITSVVLLAASLVRGGWELRTPPPILPPDTSAYAELVDGTRQAIEEQERRTTPLAAGERVDVNRDPEVELARLPGVGPALARRIIQAREERAFTRPEDLLRVPGIGDATLERIREHVEVGAAPSGIPSPLPRSGSGAPDRIDLNRASEEELEQLPGVGPALAGRIAEARRERGGFRTVEELLEVSGIGPATLDRIRPLATVQP